MEESDSALEAHKQRKFILVRVTTKNNTGVGIAFIHSCDARSRRAELNNLFLEEEKSNRNI